MLPFLVPDTGPFIEGSLEVPGPGGSAPLSSPALEAMGNPEGSDGETDGQTESWSKVVRQPSFPLLD